MNLAEIQKLYWWPENPYLKQDGIKMAHRRPDGRIYFNQTNIIGFSSPQDISNFPPDPKLNFCFDIPGVIHLEDMTMLDHRSFQVPPIWPRPRATYVGPGFLSLRVLGYLVDIWEIHSNFFIDDALYIDADFCVTHHTPPALGDFWVMDEGNSLHINARLPIQPDRFDTINLKCDLDRQQFSASEMSRQCSLHHRNFFLSLVRSQRNQHF